ncbi:MAG TPA: nucleotidyltransferase domain-containing protein [Chloroflexota bacterium]|nr:nucleotidyltransferase domain-containing protein [Chloroflexota bacterium]
MPPESRLDERPRITLAQLRAHRDEILRIAAEHDAGNVRVFGSVARGTADAGSDVDFLVDIKSDATGFAYFGLLGDLRRSLASALNRDVDVVDSAGLNRLRESILQEAVPL